MHSRIEKSATRKGEYVGYCNGAQRIRPGGRGWETYALGSASGTFTYVTAETLYQLGGKLEYIASNDPAPDRVYA
jgi:hypothetical protein